VGRGGVERHARKLDQTFEFDGQQGFEAIKKPVGTKPTGRVALDVTPPQAQSGLCINKNKMQRLLQFLEAS
jgi:hypothetical protein